METNHAPATTGAPMLEQVVIGGDLARLSPAARLHYYTAICDSLGINPLTKPFAYITLNGKLTLYATKDCTDQLRKRDHVSIISLEAQAINDVYVVTAKARAGDRTDVSTGAVSIKGLIGETLANATMKAETKAKRRVTLSICGLGMLDESETSSIPAAQPVAVDTQTGEIKDDDQPAPQPTQTAPTAALPFADYVADPNTMARFLLWAKARGLTNDDIYAALKVRHLADTPGTVGQVMATLTAFAKARPPADLPFADDTPTH